MIKRVRSACKSSKQLRNLLDFNLNPSPSCLGGITTNCSFFSFSPTATPSSKSHPYFAFDLSSRPPSVTTQNHVCYSFSSLFSESSAQLEFISEVLTRCTLSYEMIGELKHQGLIRRELNWRIMNLIDFGQKKGFVGLHTRPVKSNDCVGILLLPLDLGHVLA